MRTHWPIVATLGSAIAAYAALFSLLGLGGVSLSSATGEPSPLLSLLGAFLVGGLYAHLFEFWAHRYPMHRKLRFLRGVRLSHLRHHRAFHGQRFRTRRPEDLRQIAGVWWRFPLLLLGHFAVLRAMLPATALAAFLLGCVLHYVAFETTHWFTHIEDNGFDRFLARIPWIAGVRARQIEHHRHHHETPDVGFNFNPPYLGDRLSGLMPHNAGVPEPAPPEPVVVVASAAPPHALRFWSRPLLRYGSALVVGAAVIGLAVVAHSRWSEGRLPPVARDTDS